MTEQPGTPSILSRYNEEAMAKQVAAVYERGVLRPLEPLALAEHQHVRLTLEEEPAPVSWVSSEPVNERREELRWLARESRAYAGQWVAIEGSRLVAHGERLALVKAAANAAGVSDPLFARVPMDPEAPFGGW